MATPYADVHVQTRSILWGSGSEPSVIYLSIFPTVAPNELTVRDIALFAMVKIVPTNHQLVAEDYYSAKRTVVALCN